MSQLLDEAIELLIQKRIDSITKPKFSDFLPDLDKVDYIHPNVLIRIIDKGIDRIVVAELATDKQIDEF